MAKILTGITLLALLALHPTVSPAQIIDGIAATVNDEVITTVEVDKEYLQMQKEQEKLPPSEKIGLKSEALNRLIDKRIIVQRIREQNITVPDDELKAAIDDVKKQNGMTQEILLQALAGQGMSYEQYKSQLREQIERMKLMSLEVRAKIQVGERDLRDYYDANRAKFGSEEQYRARHIFFKVDEKGGAEALARVEATANAVLQEARAGKDFAELARKYSADAATAKDGGNLGTFKKGDMLAEIAVAVASMKPGEIGPLVKSPAGLHIIKLEEKSQSAGKSFEEVKDGIDELLFKKKTDERFAQWVKDLRAAAAISIR